MCNVSFHIVVVTGDVAVFVTSLVHTKLCLSQTIPHCKGEQNYGGVTICQDRYLFGTRSNDSKCGRLIFTLKVTFHMLLVTHVHVTSKYGVTSNKKHAAIQITEAMFSFGYKVLFC